MKSTIFFGQIMDNKQQMKSHELSVNNKATRAGKTNKRMQGILMLLVLSSCQISSAAKTLPWASNKSFDCKNECIDSGLIFCKENEFFGLCCDPNQCGK